MRPADITFLVRKHFKTVTVTVVSGKINSNDFQDGNWESNGNKGVTADAKTVTVMVMVIELIHPNFKTITVTVILGK